MTASRRFALHAGALLLAGALSPTAALAQAPDRQVWTVTVSGEGSVAVAPDNVEVRAGVTSQGKTAREASEANARTMGPVLAALKDLGVAAEDIQTTRFALQPMRETARGAAGKIVGFQAVNNVTIRIRDIGKVSEILDRMVGAGANDIYGVHFLVSASSPALDAARTAAMADARRKAEVYARAAGLALGRALSIVEEGAAAPVYMRAAAERAAAPPVAPGQDVLRVSVTVSYELLR